MKTRSKNILVMIVSLAIGSQLSHGKDTGQQLEPSIPAKAANASSGPVARYMEECGSCHMAYPPGLLPARSWHKVMGSLDKHFGEHIKFETTIQDELTQFLVKNSADTSQYRRSIKIMRSLESNEAPVRISEIPYIVGKHREIPGYMITENAKVKTLGNCVACHPRAEQFLFSESEILIPGYGRWED